MQTEQGQSSRSHGKKAKSLDLVKQRKKLIRFADLSQAGWRAVDEYVKNPIESVLIDETEIHEAQNRTERKN